MKKIIILFLALSSTVFGEDNTISLTEEKVINLSLNQNLTVKQQRLINEQAQIRDKNRWNPLLPNFSASAGLSHEGSLYSKQSEKPHNSALSGVAGLSGSFNFSGQIPLQIKGTSLQAENQKIALYNTEEQIKLQARKSFYNLLSSFKNIELQKLNLSLAEKRYEQTKINYKNGLASQLDLLQSENSKERLKPQLKSIETNYQKNLISFKNLLGIPLETPIELKGDIHVERLQINAETLIQTYLPQRLDIQIAQKQVEISKNNLNMAQWEGFSPALNITASWNNNTQFNSHIQDSTRLNLDISIPLNGYIPGSSQRTSIKTNKKEVEAAQIALQNNTQNAKEEIISLVLQLEGSWDNIELIQMGTKLAKKTYEMTESSYQQGSSELLDVEDAQNKLLANQQELLLAKYRYLVGLFDLEYALNADLKSIKNISTVFTGAKNEK